MDVSRDQKGLVEAFTINRNAVVTAPPETGIFRKRPVEPSTFRLMYDQRDLPVALTHATRGSPIRWSLNTKDLDYNYFLPVFFDGLSETAHPYEVLARQGVYDMLDVGGSKILPVVPRLIKPIKKALETRNPQVMRTTLKVLQHLVKCSEGVGVALVPFYRQILPVFNLREHLRSIREEEVVAPHSQGGREDVGHLILATLNLLEVYGGKDAFINMKIMVPTYESCLPAAARQSFRGELWWCPV